MRKEILRMERVTYIVDEVIMLEDFNLHIYQGEILGMVPLNSHGLTEFLSLLQTNLPIFDGYVYYCGEKVNSWKKPYRMSNRVSIIQAKSSLVEQLTVTDNIFVLRRGFRQELVRQKLLTRQLLPFLQDIGMDISADAPIDKLTVFERVVVELLRAVITGNRLIVLNEISSLISYEELGRFHDMLRHYAQKGFTFLYICSHLEEISVICNRTVRMSNGRIQKVITKEQMEDEILRVCPESYNKMVMEHLKKHGADEKGEEIFRWVNMSVSKEKRIPFIVHQGECVALQLSDNEFFQKFTDLLTGKTVEEDQNFFMEGKQIHLLKDRRVAVVRELPTKTMIFPELSYIENLCMSLGQRIPFLWMNKKVRVNIQKEYGAILGEETFSSPVELLSEKQKYQLIYTRVLFQRPKVVFCIHPFRGADVEHRMFIWKMLYMLLNTGISIVIVSMSLSDSLALADRLVIIDGKGNCREILRSDFGSVPGQVPWSQPYYKR